MMVLYYLENGKVKYLKKQGDRQSDVQNFKNEHLNKNILYYDLVDEELLDINKHNVGMGVSGVVMPNGDFVHVRQYRHKIFAWCYEDLDIDDNLLLMSSDCKGGSRGLSHLSVTKDELLTKEQLKFIAEHKSKFDDRQIYNLMIGEHCGFNKRDMT